MWIHIAHNRNTSNALNTLILVEKQCLEWLSKCRLSAVGISKFVWTQVPDSESGNWECSRAELATSMAWYGQQTTTCGTWSLMTGDVWDWNAAVYLILRRLLWRHRWTETASQLNLQHRTKSNYRKMGFDAPASTWLPSSPHTWTKLWPWPLTSKI